MTSPPTAIATRTSSSVNPRAMRGSVGPGRRAGQCPDVVTPRRRDVSLGRGGGAGDPRASVEDGFGRIRRVVVEAAAGLAAEVAALHTLLELPRRLVVRVLRDLVGLEARVVADVEPGKITELEWPQRVVQAQLHRLVDVRVIGHPLLEAVVGLAHQRTQDAIDQEAG